MWLGLSQLTIFKPVESRLNLLYTHLCARKGVKRRMEAALDPDVDPTTFAMLTPSNAKAKVMFSAVAESLLQHSQQNRPAFAKFMSIGLKQSYDPEAALHLRQFDREVAGDSDSITEADTDTEEANAHSNHIWRGAYTFSLNNRDAYVDSVWLAGKGRGGVDDSVDIRLTLQSDKRANNVRGKHARFQLGLNGHMQISIANTRDLYLAVDGNQVDARTPRHIATPTAKVQAGDLVYDFVYTPYARSAEFTRIRNAYVEKAHSLDDVLSLSMTPTPHALLRTIGQWALGKNLGKGAAGKVYSAVNDRGEVVAIKHVSNTRRTAQSVSDEVQTLRSLTHEARQADYKHILALKELLPDNIEQNLTTDTFQDVYMVLTPACPRTLADYHSAQFPADNYVALLRDSLLALQFLHSRRWLHRDLKPANIGIYSNRAILLDFGGAIQLPDGEHIPASPGTHGTIGYLSPERERTQYGTADDVWALGVSLFEAFFRRHPWRQSVNPWRFDQVRHLGHFREYELFAHNQLRHASPDSLHNLLSSMLRHEWSACNLGARIHVEEALQHLVFNILDKDIEPIEKRVKTERFYFTKKYST
ncbi:kinase-like protein [Amniculicola lignicola CBS 123094]|uniref:non-specific serine/threonine protein kinase n=1 Tax=Amniculicola lignicola CBS 123094 TaxID=1392246 RepID=A0A6A5WNJ8_9PLEO|nr:kinase-like protein [Amniculicola lignicola CBS 123094]